MYAFLLAAALSGPPATIPESRIDEVARQYLKAPDLEDITMLPAAVQERIFQLEMEQVIEVARIAYRLQSELTPEDFCIAAKGSEFPWKQCLLDARYALSDDRCRLHELGEESLDGIILERMYRIDKSLE